MKGKKRNRFTYRAFTSAHRRLFPFCSILTISPLWVVLFNRSNYFPINYIRKICDLQLFLYYCIRNELIEQLLTCKGCLDMHFKRVMENSISINHCYSKATNKVLISFRVFEPHNQRHNIHFTRILKTDNCNFMFSHTSEHACNHLFLHYLSSFL